MSAVTPSEPAPANLETGQSELRSRTITGSFWSIAAQGAKLGAAIVSTAVLARILSPADFGLVAIVAAISRFAGIFKDGGLSLPTIQRADITNQQISNLFWCNVGLSTLIMVAFVSAAPLIAWYYEDPRLTVVAAVSSAAFLAGGLANQHQALLRREMSHTLLASIETISVLLGHATAIGIGLATKSYWALVAIPVVQESARAIGVWRYCKWRPGAPRRDAEMKSLLQFGGNFTLFSFTGYLARNVDNLIIGKLFGLATLGFYSKAYALLIMPIQQVNGPITGVAVSALSRLQDQPERYKRYYLNLIDIVNTFAVPVAVLCAVAGDLVIAVFLGDGWEAAVPIIGWLSLCACFQPIANSTGWLFVSQGRDRDLRNIGAITAALVVVSFFAGVPWGVNGVAASYSFGFVFLAIPVLYYWVGKAGPVSAIDMARATASSVFNAVPHALALLATRWLLISQNMARISELCVCGFVVLLMAALLLIASSRKRTLVLSALREIKNRQQAS